MAKGDFPNQTADFADLHAGAASEEASPAKRLKTVRRPYTCCKRDPWLHSSNQWWHSSPPPKPAGQTSARVTQRSGSGTPPGRRPAAFSWPLSPPALSDIFSGHPPLQRFATRGLLPTQLRPHPRGPLTQQDLWSFVQRLLQPGDLPLADQGTAFHGAAAELSLPPRRPFSVIPTSVGLYRLGRTGRHGCLASGPGTPVVVVVGDGARQLI